MLLGLRRCIREPAPRSDVVKSLPPELLALDPVLVDASTPDEWIVAIVGQGRSLHVYRLGAADWLVSEVGRDNEGRGASLGQALSALCADQPTPDWWDAYGLGVD
jgi:hypothetical protein